MSNLCLEVLVNSLNITNQLKVLVIKNMFFFVFFLPQG